MRAVLRTVGSINLRPNGSMCLKFSYTSSRFCRGNICGCTGFRNRNKTGHATTRRMSCLRRLIGGCPVVSVRSNVSRGS